MFNRQFHYRLQTFTEQLNFVRRDFVDYDLSLKKLAEFHLVLKQRDQNHLNRISRIALQFTGQEKKMKFTRRVLREKNEEWIKCQQIRSMLARMVVRRGNLCQLLYQKLTRSDRDLREQEKNMHMVKKCIQSSIHQIRQIRKENEKIIRAKDQIRLEVILLHQSNDDNDRSFIL